MPGRSLLRFSLLLAALLAALSAAPLLAQDKSASPAPEAAAATTPATSSLPFTDQDVLTYMEQIIAWQKDALTTHSTDGNARGILLADALHQNSSLALGAAFDFARAQATVLDKPAEADKEHEELTVEDKDKDKANPANLNKFSAAVDQHIAELQSQLTLIDRRIRIAPARSRTAWKAQREKVAGALSLAKAQQDLIKTIMNTVDTNTEVEAGAFLKKINNLSRSAPGLATTQDTTVASTKSAADATAPVAAADAPASMDKDTTMGNRSLVALGSDIFNILRKKADVQALRQQGKALRSDTREKRATLREALRAIGLQGNDLNQGITGDVKTIEQQSADLAVLTDRFKTLSASVVPLSQAELWLDNSCRNLKEWQGLLDDNLAMTSRKFMLHLLVLGVAIMIPVIISELARRMTLRYVHDRRRQHQLRVLRRALLIAAIILVVTLNLTSELGALVTFAGFLTAGIAVALQNIILSAVAHFFFFGRYGVRAGDRVTVGGVTGDVTQVGMVRLYIAEVTGEGDDAKATGRIVAFPNSILFQPTAFYKHIA